MAQLTKAHLSAELEALRVERQHHLDEIAALRDEVARLKARRGNDTNWHVRRYPATEPVCSPMRALMQHAKQLSISTGRAHAVRNGEVVAI